MVDGRLVSVERHNGIAEEFNSTSLNRHLSQAYVNYMGGYKNKGFVEVTCRSAKPRESELVPGRQDSHIRYPYLFCFTTQVPPPEIFDTGHYRYTDHSMTARSITMNCPLTKFVKFGVSTVFSSVLPTRDQRWEVGKLAISRGYLVCSAVQESTSTVPAETKETKAVAEEAPAKPKPPAKAPAKPLPQLMEEDVIPALKMSLEAQEDISEIELSFIDNRLEGFFKKQEIPYSFWAFFPNGVLTGPKGFALSSFGSAVSTVEPFLIDEKKITAKHIVFWVEKRLAAQGIIPVWKE
ncbi:hypothetical protein NE237_001426 [Protea cynaroides]|uniref:Uncharacterized protein n=1 Tax=Protea cynaroides TaxID=273540 RepID=A0A9Q0QYG4_9MAGN|nr:hypothetical protein NE237_001426 [Protea cynaroides]